MDQWNSRRGWSKWANTLFKRDRPLGSEPWFNPEAVTEQKREWIEQQQKTQGVQEVSWPEHIYENFFVVGLPPDMELTQVAEQLCDLERKKRSDSDADTELTKEHLQPPQPSFTPQVLLQSPAGAPAPISDDEVAALCFPSGVAPEKLKRTPSLSALDELVMGRDSDQQQQCFVFMLKVGGNFPLYGCCWYVREMLHRPPYLARQQYRSCRAPFRQCMIAAPRCYCLLSHYPFFDLHFRVLKIVLDLERLERLLEYDSEKSKLRPPGPNLLSPGSPMASTPAGAAAAVAAAAAAVSRRSLPDALSTGGSPASSQPVSLSSSVANSRAQSPVPGARNSRGSAAGAAAGPTGGGAGSATAAAGAGGRQPAALSVPGRRTPDGDTVLAHVVHNRQLYCAECAGIIEDMCPFTPGVGPDTITSPPSWSQWQAQRVRGASPLGPGDSSEHSRQQQQPQEQQQQQQGDVLPPSPFQSQQQDHCAPSVGSPVRCEVCGKRLRVSTPDGLLPDSSNASGASRVAAAASAAAAGAAAADTGDAARASRSSSQAPASSLLGVVPSVLPASVTAVLQTASSGQGSAATAKAAPPASQQQAQHLDAVAAAAADFDAAGGGKGGSGGQTPEQQWPHRQGVVTAVRGAHSMPQQQLQQQLRQLSHGGGSSNSLLEAGCSTPGPETSMVQRMWETWAPKALDVSGPSAEAGHTGGGAAARLSGGLGLFKRSSRASGSLADHQPTPHTAPLATAHSGRHSCPSHSHLGEGAGAAAVGEAAEQQGSYVQEQLQQQGEVSHLHQQQQQTSASEQPSQAVHGLAAQQQDQQQSSQQLEQQSQQQSQQESQQHAGPSIQQLQHSAQQQQHSTSHAHGRSRLRPDPGSIEHGRQQQAPAAAAVSGGGAFRSWQADPDLRALSSFKGEGPGSAPGFSPGLGLYPEGPDGMRDVSVTSNASFYSVDEANGDSSNSAGEQFVGTLAVPEHSRQQQGQGQALGQSQSAAAILEAQQQHAALQQALRQRGKSEVLLRRQDSPPVGQMLPVVQLNGQRQQRWSDPASWPTRPRTPSPLPLAGASAGRASHAGRTAEPNSTAGSDGIVSAFAAIAAAAAPFDSTGTQQQQQPAQPSNSSSPDAADLFSHSSTDSELEVDAPAAAAAAAAAAAGPGDSASEGLDSSSQGGAARVNVTIGGGVIPSSDSKLQAQLQPLVVQPPSRASSGRRSALFEEVALRRSGDMSSELRTTISHLVQVDSSTLLAAYYASPIPQPGETYRLMLGDLYRLEFERCLPLQQYAPPGRSRLRQEVLTYAEVECAQHLQLWTVAALCRSLSVDNIIALVNAALLEKQLVVFCPHIGTLGSVVLALVPLLRPFTWQSLVMPVTPVNMLGFLDAPVPFVLGVQYKTPDVASRCHGLMRVNVYKDAVKNASFPAIPNMRQLAAALAPSHAALREAAPLAVERPVHVITPDEEESAQCFLNVMHDYLSKLCGDLRLHTIVNVGMSKRTGVFMKESLLESLPAKDRTFMKAFMETQMFSVYADGVISDYCEA